MNNEWHQIEFELGGDKTAAGQYVVTMIATCSDFYDAAGLRMFLEGVIKDLANGMKRDLPAEDVIVHAFHEGATH